MTGSGVKYPGIFSDGACGWNRKLGTLPNIAVFWIVVVVVGWSVDGVISGLNAWRGGGWNDGATGVLVRPWEESVRRESTVGRSEKFSGVVRFKGTEEAGDTFFPALGFETVAPGLVPTR